MTLPSIIQSTRNKELHAQLLKAYSALGQAINMYQAENGLPINRTDLGGRQIKNILMKYLKTVKDCGMGDVDAETACIPNKGYLENPNKVEDIYKPYVGNTNILTSRIDDGQFILNDGMLILIEDPMTNSTSSLYISVDVNGFNKRPNRLGQDLFMFQLHKSNGKLLPMGAVDTDYYDKNNKYCTTTRNGEFMNGAGCTAKALYDKNFWKNLP